jgi:hypothetical protein
MGSISSIVPLRIDNHGHSDWLPTFALSNARAEPKYDGNTGVIALDVLPDITYPSSNFIELGLLFK